MEKENSASGGGGGGDTTATATTGAGNTSVSDKLHADQANPLLDPSALFGGKCFFNVKTKLINFRCIITLCCVERNNTTCKRFEAK